MVNTLLYNSRKGEFQGIKMYDFFRGARDAKRPGIVHTYTYIHAYVRTYVRTVVPYTSSIIVNIEYNYWSVLLIRDIFNINHSCLMNLFSNSCKLIPLIQTSSIIIWLLNIITGVVC